MAPRLRDRHFFQLFICVLIIVATEAQVPLIISCESAVTDVLPGSAGAVVDYDVPMAISRVTGVLLSPQNNPQPPGSFFPVGITNLTYTFVDSGGSAPCSLNVIVQEVSPCDPEPCQNGGICFASTTTAFTCSCGACFSGDSCQTALQPCDNSICSGGQCRNVQDNCNLFFCDCLPCFFGQFCQNRIDACDDNNCQNGAACITQGTSCDSYTCECNGCFSGTFCQTPIPDPCVGNPCMNGGICTTTSCTTFQCNCPTGFRGDRCETNSVVIADPCNSFPCENGGNCRRRSNDYVCICPSGFAGINCGSLVTSSTDSCVVSSCLPTATCYNSYDSTSGPVYVPQYTCVCGANFGGLNCNQMLSIGIQDQCLTAPPCLNGGTCRNVYHDFSGENSYFCQCPVPFIGDDCSLLNFDPCQTNPCLNGGSCTPIFSFFVCQCVPPFSGVTCGISDVTPPIVLNCPPSEIMVEPSATFPNFVMVSWTEPFAVDGSGSQVFVSRSRTPSVLYQIGEVFSVTYTFSDELGNEDSCSFVVTAVTQPVCPVVAPVTSFNMNFGQFVTWEISSICVDSEDGPVTPTCTSNSGNLFPVGLTPVTCTCTYSGGGSLDCDFLVEVQPFNNPPSDPVCPVVEPLEGVSGNVAQVVTWSIGSCMDDEDGPINPMCSPVSGSLFDVGLTPVTCTCTDSSGEMSECDFSVEVLPFNDPPFAPVCPSPEAVTSFVGNVGQFVDWDISVCFDIQDGPITSSCSPASGGLFAVGQTPVTCTCEDFGGATSQCSFTVEVLPANSPPLAPVCPGVTSVISFPGDIGQVVTWTIEDCQDDEDGVIMPSCLLPSGSFFSVGQTSVTCTCMDSDGASSACDFIVEVSPFVDTTPPVISGCPEDILVTILAGMTEVEVTWIEPNATDDSNEVALSFRSASPGDVFSTSEKVVVTYTFTDPSENSATCQFCIEFAIVQCPMEVRENLELGMLTIPVSWPDPIGTSPSGGAVSVSSSHAPGSEFPVGETEVTYTFTDEESGEQFTCSFLVIITMIDTTSPVISDCPSNITERVDQGVPGLNIEFMEPTATDNSGLAFLISSPMRSGSFFPVGITQVTFEFSDPSNNIAVCSFTVTVTSDTTSPVISDCPSNITERVDQGVPGLNIEFMEPTATDNSGLAFLISSPMRSGSFFPVGITQVTFEFSDPSNNIAVCSFTVTVTSDTTSPVISDCPSDITERVELGVPGLNVEFMEPTATDNSGLAFLISSPMRSGSFFPVGITQVTFEFSDPSNNIAVCSFTVTVTSVSPNLAPLLQNCPDSDVVHTPSAGETSVIVNWVEPTAVSQVGGDAVLISSPPSPGTMFAVPSVTMAAYIFLDILNNQRVDCTFNIVVLDAPPAGITIENCPDDIMDSGSPGSTFVFVTWDENIIATTSSGENAVLSGVTRGPGFFVVDTITTVTYTFLDPETGDEATCSFTIDTNRDNAQQPPVITGCPADITEVAPCPSGAVVVDWIEPSATSSSGGTVILLSRTHAPGGTFSVPSVTSVEYTFLAVSNSLTASCAFTVTVDGGPNSSPFAPFCPSPLMQSGNPVTFPAPQCFDIEDLSLNSECSPASGSVFPPGDTQVVCVCTDSCGATAQCDFQVTIISDNVPQPPVITFCPDDITQLAPCPSGTEVVTWTTPTATTSSGGFAPLISNTHDSGSSFAVPSVTNVEYTFLDVSNSLTSICAFTVTVDGGANSAPFVSICPPPLMQSSNPVTFPAPQCFDIEEGILNSECSPSSGSVFPPGDTQVVCVCTDSCGDSVQCDFQVTITSDNVPQPPVITFCPDDITQLAPCPSGTEVVTWTTPTATTSSGGFAPLISNTHDPGSSFSVPSVTNVEYTFLDVSNSLTSICAFTVTVDGGTNNAPFVSNCPPPLMQSSNPVTFPAPQCFDIEEGILNSECSPSSGSVFPPGDTQVVCVCTDSCGDSVQCDFLVTVTSDNVPQPPVITFCPDDITQLAPCPSGTEVVTWTTPTATTSSGGFAPLISNTHDPESSFAVPSVTNVEYTFLDVSNSLTSICAFTVTVDGGTNNAPFAPFCPSPLMQFGNTPTFPAPQCFDVEDLSLNSECSPPSGSVFPPGDTQVVCVCTDSCGATAQCDFQVTIMSVNQEPSQPVCPTVQPVFSIAGNIGQNVTWLIQNCFDPEDGVVTPVCNPSSGDRFPVGTTSVNCICSDRQGLSRSCNFNVEVLAVNTPPTMPECPPFVSGISLQGNAGSTLDWTISDCFDSEDGSITPMCTPASGTRFDIGPTTVTCRCFDSGGLSSSCTFVAFVLPGNTEPDAPSCPSTPSATAQRGTNSNTVSWSIQNCDDTEDGSESITPICDTVSGSVFPVGVTVVSCRCTDSGGLSSECVFNVVVFAPEPLECINVPASLEVFVIPGTSEDLLNWNPPNCNPSSALLTCSEDPPQFVATGTSRMVTCSCLEGSDVTPCDSFSIAVTPTGPVEINVQNCPTTDIVVLPSTEMEQLAVFWSAPFALTNTVTGLAPVVFQSHSPGDLFDIPSFTTVTYFFADAGVSGQCVFNIRVDQPPRVTIVQPCPDDFSVSADPGVTSLSVTWMEPTAINEGGQTVPVTTQSHFPGANFPVPSASTVSYVFSDRGASAMCNFLITTSTRIVPPTIINCPSNIQVTAMNGVSVPVTWPDVGAITETGQLGVLVSSTHESGDIFESGDTRVVLVFGHPLDLSQTDVCSFIVTVLLPPPPPTLVFCPSDMTQRSSSGSAVPIFWSAPSAVTSMGALAIIDSQSHQSGDSFEVGITIVSVRLTDPAPSGQSVTCTFTVTIQPPILPPTVTFCPGDIIMTSSSGEGLVVDFETPRAVTQAGLQANIVSQSHQPGSTFPVGKSTVRYVFRDLTQPESSPVECVFCIQIDLVLPDPPVILQCPGMITGTSMNGGSVPTTWSEPTALSDGVLSRLVSQSHSPGDLFLVGDTVVTYIFADPVNSDVTSTCQFTVRIFGPPMLTSCPDDITETSPSGDDVVVFWQLPSALTSSGGVALIQSQTALPGSVFVVGVTCVEIIFVDVESGLTVSCLFKVTVLGPPEISGCPMDRTVTSVQESTTVTWVPPTASSSQGNSLSGSSTSDPGATFLSPSTNVVTYTFTDPASDLSSQCSFTITIVRPPPPTLVTCPQDIVMSAPEGVTTVTWISPSAVTERNSIAPCELVTEVSDTFIVPSMTTIVYICTGDLGASVICTFDVILSVQQTPPVVTNCPSDITLNGPPGATSVPIVWIEPRATTSSGLPPTVSSTSSPGDVFSIPSNLRVSYTFTDPLNQLQDTSCFFSIIITPTPPDEPPTIVGCPADVALNADNTEMIAVTWTEPTATSNTGGTVSVTSSHISGTSFLIPSVTTVVYTFTDSINGRSSECTFSVTLVGADTIPPTVMGCPGNIVLTVTSNIETQTVSWTPPTAIDRGEVVIGTSNISPGSEFPVGTTSAVVYTFIDSAGNEAECAFTVSLRRVDDEPPVISDCPSPISLTASPGETTAAISWAEPTATDNFGQDGVTVMRSHIPGAEFTVDTSSIVTYTFGDAAGNEATCVFTISVTSAQDNPPEVINCPESIAQVAPVGAVTMSVTWEEPTATDDNGDVTTTTSGMPGDLFVVGVTTTIIYTFMDNAGQTSVCLFTVTVVAPPDMNQPEVFGCPGPVFFERVSTGSTTTLLTWEEPVATDEESRVTTTQSHEPPIQANVGDRIDVLYTFSDASGNMDTCSFTFFVLPADDQPPMITNCPSDIRVVARQTEVETSVVSWLEPVATDAISEPVTLTVNFPPGTAFRIGTTIPVIYTAEDSAPVPNVATCTFTVTVLPFDNIDPVIENCPVSFTVPVLPTETMVEVSWVGPTTPENATFTSNFQPGDSFPVGNDTEVIYSLVDEAGNLATCSFTISVIRDGVPPAFQVPCPGDIMMLFDQALDRVAIAQLWVPPVGVEPILEVTTNVTIDPPYVDFDAGFLPVDGVTRVVRYTFADSLGNNQSCQFSVTLSEDPGPGPGPSFVNCPVGMIFMLFGRSNVPIDRIWDPVVATDPTGLEVTLTSMPENVDVFQADANSNIPVVITATNSEGQMANCLFAVSIVIDDIPPVVMCPSDIVMTVASETEMLQITWDISISDNLGTFTVVQEGANSGDTFGVGESPIRYIVTDVAGNAAMCSFNVIVEVAPFATDPMRMAPMVTLCPSETVTLFTPISESQSINLPQTQAQDEDGILLMGTLTTPSTNSFTPQADPITVTFTFTDSFELTATCTFQLELILDNTPPMIIGCPMDPVTGTILPGEMMTTVMLPSITAVDNFDPNPSLLIQPELSQFEFGITPVTYTFIDHAGNTAACTITVDVNTDPCDPFPCDQSLGEQCVSNPETGEVRCVSSDPCANVMCNAPSVCVDAAEPTCFVRCENAVCPPSAFCVESMDNIPIATLCVDTDSGMALECSPPCGIGETCQGLMCISDPIIVIPCDPECTPPTVCIEGNCVNPCDQNPCNVTVETCEIVGLEAVCVNPCMPNTCPPDANICTPTPPTRTCSSPSMCSVFACDPPSVCSEPTPGDVQCTVTCTNVTETCNNRGGLCLEVNGFAICATSDGSGMIGCDPSCAEGETCQATFCIADPRPITCNPPCEDGQTCINNECVVPGARKRRNVQEVKNPNAANSPVTATPSSLSVIIFFVGVVLVGLAGIYIHKRFTRKTGFPEV